MPQSIRCEGSSVSATGVGPEGWPTEAAASRARSIGLPPGYFPRVVCMNPASRVQGFGWDAAGRKQVRYHARERERRQQHKVRVLRELLPRMEDILRDLRLRVQRGFRYAGLPDLNTVAALVCILLAETGARSGHTRHLRARGTVGMSTLACHHVEQLPEGNGYEARFPSKHGIEYTTQFGSQPWIAHALEKLLRASCPEAGASSALFRGLDENGQPKELTAERVNELLSSYHPDLTAKHLRTWGANLRFLIAWPQVLSLPSRKQVSAAVRIVADALNHTPRVCRMEYLLPILLKTAQSDPVGLSTLVQQKGPFVAMQRVLELDIPETS